MVHIHPYSDAERLRRQLQGPWLNPLLKKWVGRGELDYEKYVRTPELLALQTPPEERVADDELLFQVAHQTQELWLKLLSHESVEAVSELDRDALWEASASVSAWRAVFWSSTGVRSRCAATAEIAAARSRHVFR